MEENFVVRGLIILPDDIVREILVEKQQLSALLGIFRQQNSHPSIGLFEATCQSSEVLKMGKIVEQVARTIDAFTIHLDHYDEFFDSRQITEARAIYIGVSAATEKNISTLRRKLTAAFKKYLPGIELNMKSGKTAHVTIAAGLTSQQSSVAKKYFTNKKYGATFSCTEVILKQLTRRNNFSAWEMVTTGKFSKPGLSLF